MGGKPEAYEPFESAELDLLKLLCSAVRVPAPVWLALATPLYCIVTTQEAVFYKVYLL